MKKTLKFIFLITILLFLIISNNVRPTIIKKCEDNIDKFSDEDLNNIPPTDMLPSSNIINLFYDNHSNVINKYEEKIYNFIVEDNHMIWEQENLLDIFKDEKNVNAIRGKIAPSMTGTYNFSLRNNNSFPVFVTLMLNDINKNDIDMQYMLKKNNEFIVDSWTKATDIKNIVSTINSKESDDYELIWKWIEHDYDTKYGINENIFYELFIKLIIEG